MFNNIYVAVNYWQTGFYVLTNTCAHVCVGICVYVLICGGIYCTFRQSYQRAGNGITTEATRSDSDWKSNKQTNQQVAYQ